MAIAASGTDLAITRIGDEVAQLHLLLDQGKGKGRCVGTRTRGAQIALSEAEALHKRTGILL